MSYEKLGFAPMCRVQNPFKGNMKSIFYNDKDTIIVKDNGIFFRNSDTENYFELSNETPLDELEVLVSDMMNDSIIEGSYWNIIVPGKEPATIVDPSLLAYAINSANIM